MARKPLRVEGFAVAPEIERRIAAEQRRFEAALENGTLETDYPPIGDLGLVFTPLQNALTRARNRATKD